MNAFERMWEAYVNTELKHAVLSDGQLADLRRAFFTGAWCQMMFTRRIVAMREGVAARLLMDLEMELAKEVEVRLPDADPLAQPEARTDFVTERPFRDGRRAAPVLLRQPEQVQKTFAAPS